MGLELSGIGWGRRRGTRILWGLSCRVWVGAGGREKNGDEQKDDKEEEGEGGGRRWEKMGEEEKSNNPNLKGRKVQLINNKIQTCKRITNIQKFIDNGVVGPPSTSIRGGSVKTK